MKTITRESPVPEQRYQERIEGDLPHSVEISTNAKGQAQFVIKLHYETITAMGGIVRDDLFGLIGEIKSALDQAGIPLAGGSASGLNGSREQ